MGTYAVYRVWVGIRKDEFGDASVPFLERVLKSFGKVKEHNLCFESIDMHGEIVGMGVVVKELSWTPSIGEENEFDSLIGLNAEGILLQVRNIFIKNGIKAEPKLYHHIDLGG